MKKYYRTELHTHSKPSSKCSDIIPEDLVKMYAENGYDSLAVTNHFMTSIRGETMEEKIELYLEDYNKCIELGKAAGLNIIFGAEIRFTENVNDYMIFGICPEDLPQIYELLPYGIDNFYREFKNDKNIIIQAHPFRTGMVRANPESIDGVEVFNIHPSQICQSGLAAKFAREHNLIASCGNDLHHYGHECLCALLTEEEIKDSYDVAKVLKGRNYKMEIGGFVIDL